MTGNIIEKLFVSETYDVKKSGTTLSTFLRDGGSRVFQSVSNSLRHIQRAEISIINM
jgi:hypothetical protein